MHPPNPFNLFNISNLDAVRTRLMFSISFNLTPARRAWLRLLSWIFNYWNQALKDELLRPCLASFFPSGWNSAYNYSVRKA